MQCTCLLIQFPTPKIEILDQDDVSTPGDQSDGLIKEKVEPTKEGIFRKKKVLSKGDKLIRLRLKSNPEVVSFADDSGKRSSHLTKTNQAIEVSVIFVSFCYWLSESDSIGQEFNERENRIEYQEE